MTASAFDSRVCKPLRTDYKVPRKVRIVGGFPLTSNGKILVITIHHHPDSTFARRVVMALIEKDIPHEKVLVDMAAREHRSKTYRALNPYGRVPTLWMAAS